MSADILLNYFNRISEAPDAIPRFRRFILDLAVRGKLTEQRNSEESVEELLYLIHSEKAQTIKRSSRKKCNPSKPIIVDEQPFPAPLQWRFIRVGDFLEMINGRAFKPTEWREHGLPIVRIQNLNKIHAPFNYCDPGSVEDRHLIHDDDFLISWSGTPGTSFGAFIWNRGLAALNQHIFRCIQVRNIFAANFLKLAINSQLDVLIAQAQGGVGLQHVTKGTLESLPLPLPPLAEQHRIVAKVDELMELCDQLQAAKNEREAKRDRLVASSLNRIITTKADEAQDVTRFHLGQLPRLTTRVEHIKLLRKTILNLAVKGRLVSQSPHDEPAAELLKRIWHEQLNLIKSGVLKDRTTLIEQEKREQLFSIPVEWRWVKLAEIITFGPQNGISPKEIKDEKAPKAITLTATTSGNFNSKYFKHVELNEENCESYWLSDGDVLFQRGNTREYVGTAAIFEGPMKAFIFPDLMIRVRFSSLLNLRYIHMALVSPPLRCYFSTNATGASATMPKINQAVLLNTPIPLPPLAEQNRIVTKVDELMALCDKIERQLTTTETDSRRLLEAVLRDALDSSAVAIGLK